MSRIRTIKPDFWRDQDLSDISAEAALLAIGLLNHADDEGYFNANPRLIQADVFPLRELSRSPTVLLEELSKIGYVRLFLGSDGRSYGVVTNFSRHQVINKPTPSKIKELEIFTEDYRSDTVELRSGMEGKGNGNGKGNGKEKEPSAPKFDALDLDLPDCISASAWSEWIQYRKGRRLPCQEPTMRKQLAFLAEANAKGYPPDGLIDTAIRNGWQGLFEPKPSAKPNPEPVSRQARQVYS